MLKATIKKWQQADEQFKAGDVNAAINTFKTAEEISKICFNTGKLYHKLRNYQEAIRYYSKAVERDAFLAIAFFQRGVAYHLLGDVNNAAYDYEDAIDRLRGHEYIDYHQLGMPYKFLLSEVLYNKAYLYGAQSPEGQQAINQAYACREVRDKGQFDQDLDYLRSGQGEVKGVPEDLLFNPPKVNTKDNGKRAAPPPSFAKTAGAPRAEPGPGASSPPSPPPTFGGSAPGPTPGARTGLPTVPAAQAGGPARLPALPTKPGGGGGAAAGGKALPSRPVSMAVKMVTLKAFYKDRRMVQIPETGGSFAALKDAVEKKFATGGLEIRYKDSSGGATYIRTDGDLRNALADMMREIYVNLPGEANEFAPAEPAGSDWQECYTDDGQTYYYNNVTGDSSWDPPPGWGQSAPTPAPAPAPVAVVKAKGKGAGTGLRAGWQKCYTDDGEVYYYNASTDESQWDPPT